ncbi:MAG: signal peptide peptidase SppA [Planctomycetota bacterium]|jgi:protease-4
MMRRFEHCAAVASVFLAAALAASEAVSQTKKSQPRSARGGRPVAVLDVGEIFRNHTRFKAKMGELKAEVARADARMKKENEALQKLNQKLMELADKPQSAEYQQLQRELAKRNADVQVQIQLQRKEFISREAVVYHTFYEEIIEEVEQYAEAKGFDAVIRLDGTQADPKRPEEILRRINRPVVWFHDRVDITPAILDRLNQRMKKAGLAATKGAAAKPSAGAAAKPKPPQGKEKPDDGPKPEPKTDAPPRKPKPDASETTEDRPVRTVVRLAVRGSFPEGPSSIGLFGEVRPSLAAMVRRLDGAARDDDVAAVLLDVRGASLGRGKLYELCAAVDRLQSAGKPVFAELASAGTSQYLLAAGCDQVMMLPNATLTIPGVRAEATFYKGLLDKLGIQFDALQMGKYKGTAESLTRSDMSQPLRESLEAVVDDTYDDLVAVIARDRRLKPDRVKTLIDRGIFSAKAAAEAGLVDYVGYPDEFRETLLASLGAGSLDVVESYRRKKPQTDFSGMTGMMKLIETIFSGPPREKATTKRKIAVIYGVGVIIPGKSATSLFGEKGVGAATLIDALKQAANDPTVEAIVLRIDSPGGSAVASDLIWREVVKTQKPVIASMGDVAGSGGYYVAMGADKILAAPDTVTGSIGVVGGKLVLGGLFDKLGITTEVISRGKNSGSSTLARPYTPEERVAWLAVMKGTYEQFVEKAARSRNMCRKEVEAVAQGRVFTGRMAVANGLIDGLGTLEDALAEAKKTAGLDPEEDVDLWILPRPRSFFEQLLEAPFVSSRLKTVAPELDAVLGDVERVRRLFSEPALALMPCRLELK